MSNDYLPPKDKSFLQWVVNFMKILQQYMARLGFPTDRFQKLSVERDDFVQKLATAEEPLTRTPVSVEAKNRSRKTLEADLRESIKSYLTYNPLVTDEDRKALGLPIHKTTRTHAPIADTHPDFDIGTGTLRQLNVHFYDQGQRTSKAKPAGQHAVNIKWAILSAPPTSLHELTNSAMDTRTPFTLHFDENERGKTVYFCLCWVNTREEEGPWSEIVSAIIP
jgi:hypothetical protein